MMRSMEINHHLALKDAQLGDTLHFIDQLKFGIIFLGEQSDIIHSNQFAKKLIRKTDGLLTRKKMLNSTHSIDGEELLTTIQSALDVHHRKSDEQSPTISIRRPSGKRPFYVTAIPLPHQSSQFPASAAVVLFIVDPEQEASIPTDYLQRCYGFTLTEAKLAQHLSRGDALREAAKHVGLSYETTRWYLKIIFQKTGTRRQSELLRLLLSDQVFVNQQTPA